MAELYKPACDLRLDLGLKPLYKMPQEAEAIVSWLKLKAVATGQVCGSLPT